MYVPCSVYNVNDVNTSKHPGVRYDTDIIVNILMQCMESIVTNVISVAISLHNHILLLHHTECSIPPIPLYSTMVTLNSLVPHFSILATGTLWPFRA